MAYSSSNFHLVKGGVVNEWLYESADTLDTVLGASYITDAVAISNSTPGKGLKAGDRVLFRRFGTVGTPATFAGSWDLVVQSTNSTTGAATMIAMATDTAPWTVDIALAASATTDGMDITITVQDADGNTLADEYAFEVFMSESATGQGLTADTYSGTLTAGTGAILTTLTAKKHFSVITASTGIFVGTLVDSANPTDQYVVVSNPATGEIHVSAASGTSWEGV